MSNVNVTPITIMVDDLDGAGSIYIQRDDGEWVGFSMNHVMARGLPHMVKQIRKLSFVETSQELLDRYCHGLDVVRMDITWSEEDA
jgi:hypothetical protein